MKYATVFLVLQLAISLLCGTKLLAEGENRFLIAGTDNGYIEIWQAEQGDWEDAERVNRIKIQPDLCDPIITIATNPAHPFIFIVAMRDAVQIWETLDNEWKKIQCIKTINRLENEEWYHGFSAVQFNSEDENILISYSIQDDYISVWETKNGNLKDVELIFTYNKNSKEYATALENKYRDNSTATDPDPDDGDVIARIHKQEISIYLEEEREPIRQLAGNYSAVAFQPKNYGLLADKAENYENPMAFNLGTLPVGNDIKNEHEVSLYTPRPGFRGCSSSRSIPRPGSSLSGQRRDSFSHVPMHFRGDESGRRRRPMAERIHSWISAHLCCCFSCNTITPIE